MDLFYNMLLNYKLLVTSLKTFNTYAAVHVV